jgi:predicted small secreted protein
MKRFKTIISYTLLVAFLMVGCVEQTDQKVKTTVVQQGFDQISIIEIDGCEYILYDGYKAGGLTHKGNCKNH